VVEMNNFIVIITPIMALSVMGQFGPAFSRSNITSEDGVPFSTTEIIFPFTTTPATIKTTIREFAFAFAARTTTRALPRQFDSISTVTSNKINGIAY
jgi:hypothetical protein